ncbi:MAG TPA: hypothetical protein PKK00_06230 [Bacteroidales bacterium]|nr:hypothetical protein [Bacteroidales bacterium]HPS16887.1 hypothetical protein [Bacteroidales bacterium]
MKIDLTKGLNIEIGGEMGKHGTIAINYLIKLGKSLQELVTSIAKNTVESSIDLNNFELDLLGIKKCCTVLEIKYSLPKQHVLGNIDEQRLFVNDQLDNLIKLSDKSDYLKLLELYPDAFRRNYIVENLYAFTTSLGNTPVRFIDYDKNNNVVPIYKIRKFNIETKNKLISDVLNVTEPGLTEEFVGHIKITNIPGKKPRQKVLDYFDRPNLCVAFKPISLRYFDRLYIFNDYLLCEVSRENNNIIIKHPMLDIIGVGESQVDAEVDFSEEFDFLYRRCNELPDKKLTKRLQKIKKIINLFVNRVEE